MGEFGAWIAGDACFATHIVGSALNSNEGKSMSTSPQDLPPLGGLTEPPANAASLPSLGSLAQAARQKSLRQARGLLIIIGLLTAGVNIVMVFTMREQIRAEVAKVQAQGNLVDHQAVEAIVRGGQVLAGGFVLMGIVFVALGLAVKAYPVPITVTAFVLYVGSAVVMALLDPEQIGRGLIFKIIIVVALVKAIQAAVAYQRESSAMPLTETAS
jgi:hypothetical protein